MVMSTCKVRDNSWLFPTMLGRCTKNIEVNIIIYVALYNFIWVLIFSMKIIRQYFDFHKRSLSPCEKKFYLRDMQKNKRSLQIFC